jgi:hypothetical protein
MSISWQDKVQETSSPSLEQITKFPTTTTAPSTAQDQDERAHNESALTDVLFLKTKIIW